MAQLAVRRWLVVTVLAMTFLTFTEAVNETYPAVIIFPDILNASGHVFDNESSLPEASTIQFWYSMERGFMDTVQPSPLTVDFIMDQLDIFTTSGVSVAAITDLLARPEVVGVLTLVILGILYSVGMVIGGLVFCYCQCCCSGYQRYQRDGAKCTRYTMSFFLVGFCVLISFGTGMLGVSLMDMIRTTNSLPNFVNKSFNTVDNVLVNTRVEFSTVMNGGLTSFETALVNDTTLAGKIIADGIEKQFGANVSQLLSGISELADQLPSIKANIETTVKSLDDMNAHLTTARTSLSNIKDDLARACDSMGGSICIHNGISLTTLNLPDEIFYSIGFESNQILDELTNIGNSNLKGLSAEAKKSYDSIEEQIEDKTPSTLTELNDTFVKARETMKQDLSTVEDAIDSLRSAYLAPLRDQVYAAAGFPRQYHDYIYYSVIALVSIFGILAASVLISTVLGATLYKTAVIPTERKGCIRANGCCLILVVYVTLMFSWLFMLLTTALFLLGSQLDSGLCPLLQGKDNFTALDRLISRSGLMSGNTTDAVIDLRNISGILNRCEQGGTFYTVLGIDSVLDIADLAAQIDQEAIKVLLISLEIGDDGAAPVDLFTGKTAAQVSSFVRQLEETEKIGALNGRLNADRDYFYQQSVNQAFDRFSALALTHTALNSVVTSLKGLANGPVNDFELARTKLKSEMPAKLGQISAASGKAKKVKLDGETAQANVQTQIKEVTGRFAARPLYYVAAYVAFVLREFHTEVGQCKPLFTVYSNTVALLCRDALPALNGIWFALGLVLVILLPTIVVSGFLAKHYRRARKTNVRDNSTSDKKRIVYSVEDEF